MSSADEAIPVHLATSVPELNKIIQSNATQNMVTDPKKAFYRLEKLLHDGKVYNSNK